MNSRKLCRRKFYGVSVSAGTENITEEVKTAIAHQVDRTLTVATWVKKRKSEQ